MKIEELILNELNEKNLTIFEISELINKGEEYIGKLMNKLKKQGKIIGTGSFKKNPNSSSKRGFKVWRLNGVHEDLESIDQGDNLDFFDDTLNALRFFQKNAEILRECVSQEDRNNFRLTQEKINLKVKNRRLE